MFSSIGITWIQLIVPTVMCDNTCEVSSVNLAYPSLGVQEFFLDKCLPIGMLTTTTTTKD